MSTSPLHAPTTRFTEAVELARSLHAEQARKGTTIPYISHLLGVASLVIEHGGNENQAIAGLLHDAVEDAGGRPTAVLIRSRFGDQVADIVEACSDTEVVPKPPWKERKKAYIAHLRDAEPDVLLVSLADKVHNARAIATDTTTDGDAVWSRFNANKEQSGWYYRQLHAVFTERLGETALVHELGIAIDRVWS